MTDRFDLEQQIMGCWQIVDDLKVLFENVVENENLTKDAISNVVLGLEELYQMKFDKLFRTFEKVTKDEWNRSWERGMAAAAEFEQATKANWDLIAKVNREREAEIQQARDYLAKYLNEFPEHDQGDIRVFAAYELLSGNDEQDRFNEVFDKIDKMIVEEESFPDRPHVVGNWNGDVAEPEQIDWVEEQQKERPF